MFICTHVSDAQPVHPVFSGAQHSPFDYVKGDEQRCDKCVQKLHVLYHVYHNKNLIIVKNTALSKLSVIQLRTSLCSPVIWHLSIAVNHQKCSGRLHQHPCKNAFHCVFVVEILALICFSSLIDLVLLLNFHYLYSLAKTVKRGT